MKNARRNIALAAVAAATLALAPSALADVRIHLNLPLPPPPHQVLRHLPPPPPVVDFGYARHDEGRWNYENRDRDARWERRHRHHGRSGYVWVEGRWVYPPWPGAVWVNGYYDRWGRWVPGYWARPRWR